ncbi:hypothetical protein ACOYX4_15675 [Enterococcus entomosocium]|uniref:hypothetical protein n=1 Tax=Enterococcus entomosocium TaxID=3034352 RepID=UPI003BE19846
MKPQIMSAPSETVYERSDAAPCRRESVGRLTSVTIYSARSGVVETPDNVYERSDAAPVTVKYQDSEGISWQTQRY